MLECKNLERPNTWFDWLVVVRNDCRAVIMSVLSKCLLWKWRHTHQLVRLYGHMHDDEPLSLQLISYQPGGFGCWVIKPPSFHRSRSLAFYMVYHSSCFPCYITLFLHSLHFCFESCWAPQGSSNWNQVKKNIFLTENTTKLNLHPTPGNIRNHVGFVQCCVQSSVLI